MSGGSLLPQKPNLGPRICRAEGRLVRRKGSGDGVLPLLFEYAAAAASLHYSRNWMTIVI
ncbi:hypothetical protein SAMN05216191_11492 [Paenibacillus jilunlii]|uniref:Uncharacterized protein n=1 Tax=Paenibacillus jilunlii TaxID=682956 RepID=A0A1G9UBF5_9BACL|nr:hypothetical protein SAMN05216191_11492 [Paenibacillus jilunlii]